MVLSFPEGSLIALCILRGLDGLFSFTLFLLCFLGGNQAKAEWVEVDLKNLPKFLIFLLLEIKEPAQCAPQFGDGPYVPIV